MPTRQQRPPRTNRIDKLIHFMKIVTFLFLQVLVYLTAIAPEKQSDDSYEALRRGCCMLIIGNIWDLARDLARDLAGKQRKGLKIQWRKPTKNLVKKWASFPLLGRRWPANNAHVSHPLWNPKFESLKTCDSSDVRQISSKKMICSTICWTICPQTDRRPFVVDRNRWLR